MENKKPLIVVLSRNYSTGLSVIRSLGVAGYTVDLVASAHKEGTSAIAASSKYVRNSVEIVSQKVKSGGDDELMDALLKYAGKYDEKPILFPTDDYTASIMDSNRSVLEKHFMMPAIVEGGEGALTRYMDKTVQSELAKNAGLFTPMEWKISLKEDIIIPNDMIYPCFCKPVESISGYKKEMAVCNNEDELRNHLNQLRNIFSERSVLIQEFLEIDKEIVLSGLCLNQKIIIPAIINKIKSAKYDRGVAIVGKVAQFKDLGRFQTNIIELLKSLHYIGMFDMEFNVVGGKLYFNEVNLRSSGTNFVYFNSGVNLPLLFVKGMLGEPYTEDETKVNEYGKTYLYEKVAWDDYFHDYLTKEEIEECAKTVDITAMCNDDDPVPGEIFMRDILERVESKERKERIKKQRENCIHSAMIAEDWTREYAKQQIDDARDRLGISYKDYQKNAFWRYSEEEQAKQYEILAERQNRRKQQKEDCITSAMTVAGWTREYAEQQIKDARKRLGISYKDYKRYEFALIPAEEQGERYEKILSEKAQKKEKKKPLVVVLSRNYSTGISVIRSLGAAGYTVDLVASAYREGRSAIAASSKYVRNSVEVVSKKVKNGGDIELVRELLKYAGKYREKPILFPTDDYTASVMDLNRDVLDMHFIMPSITGGGQGALTRCMDKTVQGELARKAGLLTPMEWIISLEEEIVIPDDMVYPCFCKPIESITGYKKEMAMCNDEAELKSHLNRLRRIFANRSVLVQEFLDIDNEIDFSGVCFDQEVIIPAIIKKTNVAQYEKGVTLAGKVVPFEELGEIGKHAVDMLKSFHYTGMFDMEFNVVGDKLYFNEVNLRSGGPNYSYFMSGVNLPALFVKEATGEKHTPEEERVAEYGKSFIYEKVAWDDYIKGFMTKKELKECIAAADITLLCNEDDPVPGKIFTKDIKKTVWKTRIKNVIRQNILPPLRIVKQIVLRYPQTKRKNRRDANSEKPRVIVSGRNYCSNLSMARSLGEAGYEVEVLRIFQVRPKRTNLLKILKPDAYSKYVKAYHVCVSRRRSRRIVNKLISLADPDRKLLLVPADDLVAYIADDYYDELSEYYIMPNVDDSEGEINWLMSKGVQKELALKAGLPVLNSCVIKTRGGKFDIPESVTYPCFIKPNVSKSSSKSRMRKCDNEEELRTALTEFSQRKDIEMLVEDYVEIGKEYSLLGLSTRDGVVGPGFFVAEEGGQEEHRGVAVTGKMLPCSQMKSLIDDLIAFVESLNYDGLYDVDLIETVDGKMYFVELNMRFGASGYAVTESGVNLPGMFADYMIGGKPVDMECSIDAPGKRFVSEKVLIEEYAMGRLPMSRVRSSMKEVDVHFVKNDADKKPYRHFKKFYLIAAVMRVLYKIKERKENKTEG